MRKSVLPLLIAFALDACSPGGEVLPPLDAAGWKGVAERAVTGLDSLLLDGFDPMGDWRLAHGPDTDWSLLAVTPEARGTWRLTLRRSAWSERSQQVLSDFQHGVLVLSEPLELAPDERVQAFFHVLVDGHELFVPDTRLARLAHVRRLGEPAAGFQRADLADPHPPLPGVEGGGLFGG